jgi:succinyl-diaminopimelate desuccinylase
MHALVEKTLKLVEIASETGDEEAICDFLVAELSQHVGYEIVRVGHSIGVAPSDRGSKELISFVGHLDTVPARGENPPRVENDRIYGLGTSDMKAALAQMWHMIENPVEDAAYDSAFIFYEAEEGPMVNNGLAALLDALPWTRDIAFGFVMEPTDNVVQLGCMGTIHANVRYHGKTAHSARPWHGDNAVHKAGALLTRLAELKPNVVRFEDMEFSEVVSATLAHGGHKRNVIPDLFELNLNSRFAPGRSVAQAKAQILDLAGGEAEVVFDEICPSGPVVLDHPILNHFKEITGVSTAPKQAWTDVSQFGLRNIPAVNFGPGDTAQAHQQNESCSVQLLEENDRMVRAFLSSPSLT